MHPKAAYLALHGYRIYIFTSTHGPRIKRHLDAREPTLIRDNNYPWSIGKATDMTSYTETTWDRYTYDEWEQLPQELLEAFVNGRTIDGKS